MVIIEAYWQPRLSQIVGEPPYAVLGWATARYFAMTIVGPMLISFIADKFDASPAVQIKVLPFILALGLNVVAIQTTLAPFLAAYMSMMLFISMFNPPATTMQSIFSLVLRGGGAVSMFVFAGLIKRWDITTVRKIVTGYF